MNPTPEDEMEHAKDHLVSAKNEMKSATHDKLVEKVTVAGEKIKGGIDHLVEKITPEPKA